MADIGAITRRQVERVLDNVRIALEANGGSIELIDIEDNDVRVALECRDYDCPSSILMLKFGIERTLRETVPGFGKLIVEVAGRAEMPSFDY